MRSHECFQLAASCLPASAWHCTPVASERGLGPGLFRVCCRSGRRAPQWPLTRTRSEWLAPAARMLRPAAACGAGAGSDQRGTAASDPGGGHCQPQGRWQPASETGGEAGGRATQQPEGARDSDHGHRQVGLPGPTPDPRARRRRSSTVTVLLLVVACCPLGSGCDSH